LLIIAGAGTGKTTVITERIKWLITKQGISPSQILALTFTEKAASEMEERVDLALPLGYSQMWISTFHSFCDRILRQEAIHIGLNPDFKLLTEAESILFLRRRFFKLKLNYFRPASNPTKFLGEMIKHFSRLRDEDISPKQYLAFAQKQVKKADTREEKLEAQKTSELANAFAQYQKLKDKESMMDFADLINNTLRLFREKVNVLKEYQDKFRYLLIDEFQDTNIAQNELVTLLAENGNITVTGDDDQAVYKWRGAAISNIILFKKRFPKTKIIVLTRNYRSTKEILDRSYQLIQHNNPDRLEVKEKIDKKLVAHRNVKGEPIQFFFASRVEEEADWIVRQIIGLTEKKYQFKDIAILVRANNHAEPLTRALARQAIPYQFLGPGQLFRQPEIKDLIAYLSLINDPQNDVAAFRVGSIDTFNISARDLIFIKSFAKKYNLSLFEGFELVANNKFSAKMILPNISQKTKAKITRLVKMIHHHLKRSLKESGGQILYYFLQDAKILNRYLNPKTEREQAAAQNIAKFFDRIKSFESQNRETTVVDLLDWITLRLEMGESPLATETDWSENNAINILTVHSAKGLEFPAIFLTNLVNQRFPVNRRRETIPLPQPLIKEILPEGDAHEQEERRLFYVAMTRAKDRLHFTAAKLYFGGKRQKRLSPFVVETLGDEIINRQTKQTETNNQLALIEWEKKEELCLPPNLNPPVNYLSFSQIDAFQICPQQYKYKYVLRIPTPPSSAQSFGTAIHQALKMFYQRQLTKKTKLPEKQLLAFLESCWSGEGFTSKAHEKSNKIKAKRMLRKFYVKEYSLSRANRVIALEQPFSFKLTPALTIGGKIDRVDNLKNDRVEIIDYKTGAKVPSQNKVDGDEQLSVYALAVSQIKELAFSRPVDKITLTLHFLDPGKKISTQRTREQIGKIKEKIIKVAQELEKTNFPPKPNRPFPCDYCEFRLLCDAWR